MSLTALTPSTLIIKYRYSLKFQIFTLKISSLSSCLLLALNIYRFYIWRKCALLFIYSIITFSLFYLNHLSSFFHFFFFFIRDKSTLVSSSPIRHILPTLIIYFFPPNPPLPLLPKTSNLIFSGLFCIWSFFGGVFIEGSQIKKLTDMNFLKIKLLAIGLFGERLETVIFIKILEKLLGDFRILDEIGVANILIFLFETFIVLKEGVIVVLHFQFVNIWVSNLL